MKVCAVDDFQALRRLAENNDCVPPMPDLVLTTLEVLRSHNFHKLTLCGDTTQQVKISSSSSGYSSSSTSLTVGPPNRATNTALEFAVALLRRESALNLASRRKIHRQNTRDSLTQLLNRREFYRRLSKTVARTVSNPVPNALLLVDLDFFKVINETFGSEAGDAFLQEVAGLIKDSVRAQDCVARLGGDEFGLLLRDCDLETAQRIATHINQRLTQHQFCWDDRFLPLTASIALVVLDCQQGSVEYYLARAEAAIYTAKEAGGNRCQVYDEHHSLMILHQKGLMWFGRIHAALENNRFILYAQKINPLSSKARKEGCHYELLIRMLEDDGSIISPGEFLPVAERYNLMPMIDRWVITRAFQWLAANASKRHAIGVCSVNVSGASLCDESFCNYVLDQFQRYRVRGENICFEITETMAIRNLQRTLDFIAQMKQFHCKFSLDDFGSGFSSYGHLRSLPVDYVKIDGQFVRQMADDPVDYAMVKSINELGHLMRRQTIAEFVEDDTTLEKLRSLGVDYVQGYGIEKPRKLVGI
ncbi:Conserved hypothetical protein [gamma proteobacterium HdN1]|nr:Conserved hypothetical protein [gamma proteobacterium HdN1]